MALWGALGFGYFAWDTLRNEYIWSRNDNDRWTYWLSGPIIWLLLGFVSMIGMMAKHSVEKGMAQ